MCRIGVARAVMAALLLLVPACGTHALPPAPAAGGGGISGAAAPRLPATNEAFRVNRLTRDADVFTVEGSARTFEGGFVAEVLDAAGQVLAHVHVQAGAGAPEWGAFRATLQLPQGAGPRAAVLRLYEPSARDGSPTHVLTVRV